ncbi:hypothetical protein DM806_12895 [Sphingobium lactosutens]|uniref:hypothetical protein n=1 Tax=Sphingobium lactosutens TaxID=522773 RepID=UPI0015BF2384|nr:hypothetical protein [Sphingobium lactosutens]NWK96541.1 hypothetical protein [Sphingobium lactosutens]
MMRSQRILTNEQLDEMATLRERGWSAPRIAAHFAGEGAPISKSTVYGQCKRIGADVPARLQHKTFQRRDPYWRAGQAVRPWSAEEDGMLLDLEQRGTRINAIARQLGRANSSVRGRLLTLARREARSEGTRL